MSELPLLGRSLRNPENRAQFARPPAISRALPARPDLRVRGMQQAACMRLREVAAGAVRSELAVEFLEDSGAAALAVSFAAETAIEQGLDAERQ